MWQYLARSMFHVGTKRTATGRHGLFFLLTEEHFTWNGFPCTRSGLFCNAAFKACSTAMLVSGSTATCTGGTNSFFSNFFLRPASFCSAGGFSSASWALLARFPAPAIGGHSAAAVEGLESCKFKRWRKVESMFGKVNRKRKAAPGLPSRTPAWCWAAISNRRQIAC